MADLTVLSSLSPIPAYPSFSRPTFSSYNATASSSRIYLNPLTRAPAASQKKLASLDIEAATTRKSEESDSESISSASSSSADTHHRHGTPPPEAQASSSQSPIPLRVTPSSLHHNSIVSPIPHVGPRPRHRPTRSQSAPPERTSFQEQRERKPRASHTGTLSDPIEAPAEQHFIGRRTRMHSTYGSSTPIPLYPPSESFGSRVRSELSRPPPPLHRPTTFWRRTPRSGVTSSSYSPSTHLVRRSTFLAAGLTFDQPGYDASALSVESRIGTDSPTSAKLTSASQVFWEVIV